MFDSLGVGTVQAVTEVITVEVRGLNGGRFSGTLSDDVDAASLCPGVVLLVAFDPAAPERLSLADDVHAVRAAL